METWGSSYFYDELSGGVSSVMDPLDYISRHQQNLLAQSFMCKQELEASDGLNLIHYDQFVQLPQLQSPSLPPMKRPASSVSLTSENNFKSQEDDESFNILNQNNDKKKKKKQVMRADWRALDKFVASQLMSQEDDREGVSGFGGHQDSNKDDNDVLNSNNNNDDDNNEMEMASLILMEGDKEEENRFINGLLRSSSDCDIGICVFDK